MKPAHVRAVSETQTPDTKAHAAFKAHAARQKRLNSETAETAHKARQARRRRLSPPELEPLELKPELEPEPEVELEIVTRFPLTVTLSGLTSVTSGDGRAAVYAFFVRTGPANEHSFDERYSGAFEKHQRILALELPAFAQIDAVFPGLQRTSQDIFDMHLTMERGEQLAIYYTALLRAAAPQAEVEARATLREMYGIMWPEAKPSPRAAEYTSSCAEPAALRKKEDQLYKAEESQQKARFSDDASASWVERPTITLDRGTGNGMSLRAFFERNFVALFMTVLAPIFGYPKP